jgi:hypothetical protein
MSVATKLQPNFTTQTAAVYKGAIDGMLSVHDHIAGQFAPRELNVGSPVPDLVVSVDPGKLMINGALYDIDAQSAYGFTVPAAGYERVDRVVLNPSTGAVSRVAGVAVTGSPGATAPAIPAGYLPICRVTLNSSTPVITNSMIIDERLPNMVVGMVPIATGVSLPSANFVIVPDIPQGFRRLLLGVSNYSFDTGSRRLYVYHNSVTSGYGGFMACAAGMEYLTATGAVLGPTVAAATVTHGVVEITNYQVGMQTQFRFNSVGSAGADPSGGLCALLDNKTALTYLTFAMSSTGNFDGGTYDLWGEL